MTDFSKFLPLLILYFVIALSASTEVFQGDEGRYVEYAQNLSVGFYSPKNDVSLWNGPGYPIVLLPFILFDLPLIFPKLLNAVFSVLAVYYLYRSLNLYLGGKQALFVAYLFGLYPPFLRTIHLLLTENLVIFLISGFVFHFCCSHRKNSNKKLHLIAASLYLGYLAITKIFFGYVLAVCLIVFSIGFLWKRLSFLKTSVPMWALALFLCIPYLIYTYDLTGRVFYWGNSGGASLYWMSTPYQGEFGDWISSMDFADNPQLCKNHCAFFKEISNLNSIERDDALKKQAIENISEHPKKFFMNLVANISRMFFSYPFSYTPQKLSTLFFIIPNMFVIVLAVLCIYPSFVCRHNLPREIFCLLFFIAVAFAGSSFLSAYDRQFRILIPIMLLWISFVFFRLVNVEFRK